MATNRSRRLRKKLCVDEFQELGFELNLGFKEDLSDEAIDAFLDASWLKPWTPTAWTMSVAMTSAWSARLPVAR
jgi:uncharacterized protein YggL (DUF469 family)